MSLAAATNRPMIAPDERSADTLAFAADFVFYEGHMTISDSLMMFAVLIAPFLAVFAQKQIENWRTKRDTKLWIFKTLMATRGATLSFNHVQALNMIDLEFSDRNLKEKEVKRIWKEYLNHLGSLPTDPEQKKAALPTWSDKRDDYLAGLLEAMGKCFGYDFDKVYIKKGIYSPEGHAQDELEQRAMRFFLLQVLQGQRRFPIAATLEPADEAAAKFGKKYQKSIIEVLEGKSDLKVTIHNPSAELGTVPNGAPAPRPSNLGTTEGPPSVS
ncbi:MAG TPA: DUF6680 family protein [Verrucomicrobiae bacterium]